MHYREIRKFTTKLRRNQTKEEEVLWASLRKRQLSGYKFLRQHAVIYQSDKGEYFYFVPDFACMELKLIIELDGGYHYHQQEKDEKRDQILQSLGFRIIRIWNEELADIAAVLQKIEQAILSIAGSGTHSTTQSHRTLSLRKH